MHQTIAHRNLSETSCSQHVSNVNADTGQTHKVPRAGAGRGGGSVVS